MEFSVQHDKEAELKKTLQSALQRGRQQSKVQKGLRILRKGDLIKGYRKRL